MNLKFACLVTLLLVNPVMAADHGALLQQHQMVDLAGEDVSLADYSGEVLIVNFWASWCAPCLLELPKLDAWNTAWADQGARVVAISIDNDEGKAREFVEAIDLKLTVWVDGPKGLARVLDLPAVPTSYVIDGQGKIVLRVTGSSDQDLELMHKTVTALLKKTGKGPRV